MPNVGLQYVLLGGLAIALLFAAVTDIRRREIDNWLNAGIALAAPLFWWACDLPLWPGVAWQVGLAAITFAVLLGMFALGAMGGGDVKLLTALALWFTPLVFLRMVIIMSLIGGVLTLALWLHHAARQRKDRLAVPYGVAISAAGLWALASKYAPSLMPTAIAGVLG